MATNLEFKLSVSVEIGEFNIEDFKKMLNQLTVDMVKMEGKKVFFKIEELNTGKKEKEANG